MHAHRSVLEHRDTPRKVGDHLGRELALLGDGGGKLARVLLDVLDVGLELSAKLLKVLNDGALDGAGEVGMVVGDLAGLLTLPGVAAWHQDPYGTSGSGESTYNAVEDVLDSTLAQELLALRERDLDDAAELGEFLCRVGLGHSGSASSPLPQSTTRKLTSMSAMPSK